MIWTEEENEKRQINNVLNMAGKKCKNCLWSNYEPGDVIITCGHHHQNFSSNSFCAYWTSAFDLKVKAYRDAKKTELRARLNNKKQ